MTENIFINVPTIENVKEVLNHYKITNMNELIHRMYEDKTVIRVDVVSPILSQYCDMDYYEQEVKAEVTSFLDWKRMIAGEKGIRIHTRTQEQYNKVIGWAKELCNLIDVSYFTYYKENTVVWIAKNGMDNGYSSLKYATETKGTPLTFEAWSKEYLAEEVKEEIMEVQEAASVNPKAAFGLSNIPVEMFSPIAIAYGAMSKYNGALKYGKSNFIGTEVVLSIYLAALQRHLAAFIAGEENDPADGCPHLGAILANVDIILCARAAGTLIDDRSMLKGYREEMEKLKPLVASLQGLHKDKNPKHFYLDESLTLPK